jgi:hypothetical protein
MPHPDCLEACHYLGELQETAVGESAELIANGNPHADHMTAFGQAARAVIAQHCEAPSVGSCPGAEWFLGTDENDMRVEIRARLNGE